MQPSVESGLDLQRFIHQDDSPKFADDNVYSETVINNNIANEKQKFPNFALIEEVDEPAVPLYYDVPIKIEETSPTDDIRTIYVPIENAINVPDSVDVNLGSFGYDKLSSISSSHSVDQVTKSVTTKTS